VSSAENKQLIRRFFAAIDEGCRAGNADMLDEFLAPDFVEHNPFPGVEPTRDGWKRTFENFVAGAPGRHVVEELVAEDDLVTGRITAYGTHVGELFGIPATGRDFSVTGIAMWRLRDGKIVEHWHQTDQVGLMQQLGAPPPG
jgi:steroid delta-isomerase-like uncharacterized protein